MEIVEALAQLDVTNDKHWTGDGLPKVDVVANLVGDDKLTRALIVDAAPEFNRSLANAEQPPAPTEPEAQVEVAPAGLAPHQVHEKNMGDLEVELAVVAKELDALNGKRKALETRIHWESVQADRLRPQDAGQQNITDYLAGQRKITQDRAAIRRQLQESGVAALLNQSTLAPIDAAMKQRKPARGTVRPTRPA